LNSPIFSQRSGNHAGAGQSLCFVGGNLVIFGLMRAADMFEYVKIALKSTSKSQTLNASMSKKV